MTTKQKNAVNELRRKGVSYPQIAKELGIPFNTLKSWCYRNKLTEDDCTKETTIKCKNCGQNVVDTYGTKPRLFCSKECKQQWWNKHRKTRESKRMTVKKCPNCGTIFSSYISENRIYCSQDCYQRGRKNDE